MGSADCLRQQHRELLKLASDIAPLLEIGMLARGCTAARLRLSTFVRKLRVHLALEERYVYQRLVRHADRAVATLATRHHQETRSLGELVTRHADQWRLTDDAAIEGARSSFAEQTKHLFEEVSKRFRLEDDELYPLVDQIRSSGTWPFESIAEQDEKRRTG